MALSSTEIAQASSYFEGAVTVILRSRPLLGLLDAAGRINKDFQGKDMNWLLEYRGLVAEPYTPFQDFNFSDTNLNLLLSINPVFWAVPSALDMTQRVMNQGPSMIVDQFEQKLRSMAEAMERSTAYGLYNDVNSNSPGSGNKYLTGLQTFAHASGTVVPTTWDRVAAPDETVKYGGASIGLGSQGGSWSTLSTEHYDRMCNGIGTDWPDGVSGLDQRYDVTSPRLYNENTNQWTDPGADAAASNWRTNCVAMISRAGTDLKTVSIGAMMPNIHLSNSGRYQALLDQVRTAFRYTMAPSGQAANLGYVDASLLEYEGTAFGLDAACPPNYTFSLCYKSVSVDFFSGERVGGATMVQQRTTADTSVVTGGIYAMVGPHLDPKSLATLFLMFAGGQMRWTPRYVTVHGNFVPA